MEEKPSGEENVQTLELKPKGIDPNVLQYQLLWPIAKRFSGEIGRVCNQKFKGGAHMAVTCAAFIFRNMLVQTTRQLYKPRSEEGENFIKTIYNSAQKDALIDWREDETHSG